MITSRGEPKKKKKKTSGYFNLEFHFHADVTAVVEVQPN